MTDTQVLQIGMGVLVVVLKLAAPVLVVCLVVGFAISLFQSVTQIQEVTLTFVPKALAVALVLLVAGHWMLSQVVTYTQSLFAMLPQLLS